MTPINTTAAAAELLPTVKLAQSLFDGDGIWIVKLLVEAGMAGSNGDARRLIQGGGAYINEERISDANRNITAGDFKDGALILKAGKKNIKRIVME